MFMFVMQSIVCVFTLSLYNVIECCQCQNSFINVNVNNNNHNNNNEPGSQDFSSVMQ